MPQGASYEQAVLAKEEALRLCAAQGWMGTAMVWAAIGGWGVLVRTVVQPTPELAVPSLLTGVPIIILGPREPLPSRGRR